MSERTAILGRMFAVFGLLLLAPCAIGLQLVRINFWEGEELRKLWSDQAIDTISIPAQRGNIYDEDGSLLATNSVAYRVAVDPHVPGLTRDQLKQLSATLSRHTGMSADRYMRKIDNAPRRSRYIVLEKNIDTEAHEDIRKLEIHGVIQEEEYKRRYSFGSLAAHVLGFVNHGMDGQIGLEKEYDQE